MECLLIGGFAKPLLTANPNARFPLRLKGPLVSNQVSKCKAWNDKEGFHLGTSRSCLSNHHIQCKISSLHKRHDKKGLVNATSGHSYESEPDYNPNNLGKSTQTAIDAFYRFSRPHTVIGTALSIISVSLLAVEKLSDFSPMFFTGLLQAIVAALFMNIYIVGLNQLSDIDIDKVNKPYLPLASGEYSVATGVMIVTSFAIMMTEERGYNLFSAANSNTPSMEIQQKKRYSSLSFYNYEDEQEKELQETKIEDPTSYILERLSHMEDILDKHIQRRRHEEESRRLYVYNLYQWQLQYAAWQKQQEEIKKRAEILRQEQEVMEVKKRQEEAKAQEIKRLEITGVPKLFDEYRFPVIRTKYASTPSFLPCDFFALFGDDDDAEIFSTMVEKVEVTSREVIIDNLKGEEQGIVFKGIFFGSIPNGVMVLCENKVFNEGMVDGTLPGKVGIVQATDVEPRKKELLHGDAFVASKDKDANFVDMLKQ